MSGNGTSTISSSSSPADRYDIMPVYSLDQAIARRQQMIDFVKSAIMVEGSDYGKIPGTDKPTLLKPGAEKLLSFFGLSLRLSVVEKLEDWDGVDHNGEPLFYYWYRAQAWRGDVMIAEADGSANSRENKYRWRWVTEDEVPLHMDLNRLARRSDTILEFAFAVDEARTVGPYGKPAEHWQRFKDAIADGSARAVKKATKTGKMIDAWEIGRFRYRIPNDEAPSIINTLQKMAQKRAIVAVCLLAVNASEFFTQDVEDLVDVAPSEASTLSVADPHGAGDAPTARPSTVAPYQSKYPLPDDMDDPFAENATVDLPASKCVDCGAELTPGQKAVSMGKFQVPLCPAHQKERAV